MHYAVLMYLNCSLNLPRQKSGLVINWVCEFLPSSYKAELKNGSKVNMISNITFHITTHWVLTWCFSSQHSCELRRRGACWVGPSPGLLVWISSRQPSKIKTGLTHTNLVRLKLKPSEFDNFFSESIIVFQFVHCDIIIPFCLESSVLLLLLMTHRSNCFPYHFPPLTGQPS